MEDFKKFIILKNRTGNYPGLSNFRGGRATIKRIGLLPIKVHIFANRRKYFKCGGCH